MDAGLEMVEDSGLLDEVAGLVEWPVPVLGKMDPAFLDLPAEVIRLSMRTHQKYFAVRDPATGKLAPNFITVANIDAVDGGKAIAAGNARVLSARLNDARYFWDLDRFYDPIERTKPKKLDAPERIEKLKQIVFHQKLGSVWDKVERVRALAKELCAVTGADPALVDRAAVLSKCDLVTEVVGEFPELQGQIGRQIAEWQSENASVAIAVEDHYRPMGPNDRVPTDKAAITLALAEKCDMLSGFWAADEKPTGSKDPYALRRAALGIIRTVLEGRIKFPLRDQFRAASFKVGDAVADVEELTLFMSDRLKVQLRDQGKRHDLVDAALRPGGALDDDLVRIVRRVEALEAFLKTDDGVNLLAGYKRAVNILRAEEKKEAGLAESLAADLSNNVNAEGVLDAERNLAEVLAGADLAAQHALNSEDFAGAMGALARLRAPVDAFFDQVLVNDPDPMLRRSRLLLLSKVRAALERVADFSQIEG
jgi:glycyl-tRNA synthetase beta chain